MLISLIERLPGPWLAVDWNAVKAQVISPGVSSPEMAPYQRVPSCSSLSIAGGPRLLLACSEEA